MVRAEGLEPTRLASLEPKSSASTSSATPAAPRKPGKRGFSTGMVTGQWENSPELQVF